MNKDFERKFVDKDDPEFVIGCVPSEKLWEWVEKYAEEMCKKQREICATKYEQEFSHKFAGTNNVGINPDIILNTPLPQK